MENASKALQIAGAILIAMLTIGLIIYLTNNISIIAKNREEQTKQKQILELNDNYESYNKKILYGADVLTVYNRATENNNNLTEAYYHITIEASDTSGTALNIPYILSLDPMADDARIFKTSIFECTEIIYSNTTGRVERMKFVQKSRANL